MMKIKNKLTIRHFILLGGMMLAIHGCKEEELVFPKNANTEVEVSENRPTARPTNLTFVSAFNQSIEIYWPDLSDRVVKAQITYNEGVELKKIEIVKFDQATILQLDQMKEYLINLQYFTSEGTASKITMVSLTPRPFETDYKISNVNVQPIPGGVTFIFPTTSTREIPGTISYSFNGKNYNQAIKGNVQDTVVVHGLTDETKPIDFSINFKDDKWNRNIKGDKQIAPGLMIYKLILPTLLAYVDGNDAILTWKNTTRDPLDIQVNYQLNGINKIVDLKGNTDAVGKLSFDVGGKITILNVTLTTDGTTSPVQIIQVKPLSEIIKSGWSAIVSDNQAGDGGGAAALIDGNITTFWHSQYSPSISFPHWFKIDFGKEEILSKIGMIRRGTNTNGFVEYNLETSVDGINFTNIGTALTFDPTKAEWQDYKLPNVIKARYVRVTMTKAKNAADAFTHLGEFRALGH